MARASKYEEKRDEVLSLILRAATQHSKPPTVRDLAAGADVGVATMHSYLQKLAEEEMVEWTPGRHRSLKLSPKALQQLSQSGIPSA